MKVWLTLMCVVAVTHCQDQKEKFTVDPDAGGASSNIDWSQTDYQNKYCVATGKECPGNDFGEKRFAATVRQCQSRCSADLSCAGAFLGKDKICQMKSKRCTSSELVSNPAGNDHYRLKKGEQCPTDRPEFVENYANFSNSFCLMSGKSCPGHDLYPKPQNIFPLTKCLQKCTRIRSCASVDFKNNKCSPKDYNCQDSELVDDPDNKNLMRLEASQPECGPNRKEPIVDQPSSTPAPTTPPAVLNEKCEEVGQADIMFVIDASGSVEQAGFDSEISFVNAVISQLDQVRPDGNGIRIGAMTYSFAHTIQMGPSLSQPLSNEEIRNQISALTFTQGGTFTAEALNRAGSEIEQFGRPGIPHIVVTLTDGKSASEGATIAAANSLRARGYHLMSVGIGTELRESELVAMADKPTEKFRFIVNDFGLLNSIAGEVKKALFCAPVP